MGHWWESSSWHTLCLSVAYTVSANEAPIPGLRPRTLVLPEWGLYVGVLLAICIGAILWWRCIVAGDCSSCHKKDKSALR